MLHRGIAGDGGEGHKKKLRVAAQVTQASSKIRKKSKSKTSELSGDSMVYSDDFYSEDEDSVFGSGDNEDYDSEEETVTVDEREAAAKAAKAAAADIGGDPSALSVNINEIRKYVAVEICAQRCFSNNPFGFTCNLRFEMSLPHKKFHAHIFYTFLNIQKVQLSSLCGTKVEAYMNRFSMHLHINRELIQPKAQILTLPTHIDFLQQGPVGWR